jgi:enoyl-CoA hydratase/carnithine racemase
LPREIGLKRAMGILLTGRHITAHEGFELGFVNEVTDGNVMVAARRWAAELLGCSPLSLRATKEAVLKGLVDPPAKGHGSSAAKDLAAPPQGHQLRRQRSITFNQEADV